MANSGIFSTFVKNQLGTTLWVPWVFLAPGFSLDLKLTTYQAIFFLTLPLHSASSLHSKTKEPNKLPRFTIYPSPQNTSQIYPKVPSNLTFPGKSMHDSLSPFCYLASRILWIVGWLSYLLLLVSTYDWILTVFVILGLDYLTQIISFNFYPFTRSFHEWGHCFYCWIVLHWIICYFVVYLLEFF